jgi:hypothetical protein
MPCQSHSLSMTKEHDVARIKWYECGVPASSSIGVDGAVLNGAHAESTEVRSSGGC